MNGAFCVFYCVCEDNHVSTPVFSRLSLQGWRQFKNIDIELHPRLTVLTGANGSGKSTLLSIFSRHFGWNRPYLATPRQKRDGQYEYLLGLFNSPRHTNPEIQIGELFYSHGASTALSVPGTSGIQYHFNLNRQLSVSGIHVSSHQVLPTYQQVGQLPMQAILPEQAYGTYQNESVSRYMGSNTNYSPLYRVKEALISMAVFGPGNKYVQENRHVLDAYLGFIDILRELLPASLGFQNISIRPPDVVLQTASGDFLIDAASGGVMTLIDLAWQIFMFSLGKQEFVVTIDEPENHLHPSMQRSLMGNLLRAFPKVQFIIATHSPFMVSSVRDSNVYVLQIEDQKGHVTEVGVVSEGSPQLRVISTKLDTINKAGSASEILREVLGVQVTIPQWAEDHLGEIVKNYRSRPITSETLLSLRGELEALGFTELYPDALAALTEGK
jgi:hypothetical protein